MKKADKKSASAQGDRPKTRYDRKMEARRLQEAKDKRDAMIAKTAAIVVLVAIVAAVVFLVAGSVIKKQQTMNDTYVMIGNSAVTKHEYDFYFNTYLNQFLSTYSSIISYMGLDTTKDLSTQPYDETRSWKDVFDESTVNMLVSTKSMYQEAMDKQFEYDVKAEYDEIAAAIANNAEAAGVSVGRYYKLMYGDYATVSNVRSYIEEGLIAEAYYNKLIEDNKPSDETVQAYYEENKKHYDLASYYSFTITAGTDDSGNQLISEADAKKMAEEMAQKAEKGEDFETLCLQYATDTQKISYEDPETEFSLSSAQAYSSINSLFSEWIYDDTREEGDVEVFEDADNMTYYIIKYVSVDYDETCLDTISNSLAANEADAIAADIAEKCEVKDVKGDLKYLVIEEPTEGESSMETDAETETETSAQ